ncbi:unnamed protein product [Rotaria socialis]
MMKRRQNIEFVKENLVHKTKLLKTQFEDLSNELIYEIFDYFDYFYIYEIFSKLNLRFQSLLIDTSLRLKIKLSSISKSILQNQYKSIIYTRRSQIISLNISKYFLEYFPLNLFPSLQCLTIQQIQFYQILLLINHLNCLANFSSLTIQTSDYFQDENSIYLAIFRLAKLKFCKLTFPSGGQRIPLPLAIDQCQTLECLVLNGHCRLDQLISILSYVPKLHRLACEQLSGSEYIDITRIPENLTSISLTPYRISFNELKLLLTSKISFKLKKLRIKIFNNETFFHAEQWEELILNYMPCLHSFDLQYTGLIDECCQLNLIAPFHSKFWIDRQWSFDYYYHSYGCDDLNYLTFFSIVSYRSNHYTLYEPLHNDICESFQNNSINFARHLTIHRCVEFDKYSIRFSRVTKLTLKNNSIKKNASFMKNINSLVPLIQITDLDIKNNNLSIIQLSKILCLLPNLQSLSLSNTSLFHSKHNTTVNLSSRNNKITKLIIDDDDDEWDIKHIQFLLRLFPYLQYLEIGIDENNLDDILQYLLLKFKSLFSLFLLNVNHEATKKIETFIKSENLIHDYTIEHIRGGLYLWW